MSLFQELKRRNVFRVGIAYAVAGWLVLQLADVLSELLHLPDTIVNMPPDASFAGWIMMNTGEESRLRALMAEQRANIAQMDLAEASP